MKNELNKKIRELCESAGSMAAVRMVPVLTTDLDREYDRRIEAGMTELDAYRDVLRSVDRIEAMLRSLPKDEQSGERAVKPEEPMPDRTAQQYRIEKPFETEKPEEAPDWMEDWKAERRAGLKRLEGYTDKISSLLWVGTTLLYFLWSLAFGGWRWTWLIFLWATLGQILLSGAVEYNKTLNLNKTLHSTLSGCLWVGAVIVFFLAGFWGHLWRFSWLVFLAATLIQILMGIVLPEKE